MSVCAAGLAGLLRGASGKLYVAGSKWFIAVLVTFFCNPERQRGSPISAKLSWSTRMPSCCRGSTAVLLRLRITQADRVPSLSLGITEKAIGIYSFELNY